MASADVNLLIDNARMRLPGALDKAIQFELFTVLDEFLQTTCMWTEDISVDVLPTSQTYLENPDAYKYDLVPDGGAIYRLMYCQNTQGMQQKVTMPEPGTLILQYAPSTADTYIVTVAKAVTDPVTREGYPEVPAWIIGKYSTELLDGVLGRMMSQIAKPYSSPQMASYHTKLFRAGTARARVETMHGNVYRAQSWWFPQTFARRRRYNGF
jgi:hypothetical protein